jgi:hypothetical protein
LWGDESYVVRTSPKQVEESETGQEMGQRAALLPYATLLVVQAILGHKFIDMTLGCARLYDGTMAADYCRGMAEVESCFKDSANAGNPSRQRPTVGSGGCPACRHT